MEKKRKYSFIDVKGWGVNFFDNELFQNLLISVVYVIAHENFEMLNNVWKFLENFMYMFFLTSFLVYLKKSLG